MTAEQFANGAQSTLSSGMGSGDSSLSVTSATGFPESGQFRVLIDSELIIVGAVSGSTFSTLMRGAESTTAATHANGATITHVLTAGSLTGYVTASVATETTRAETAEALLAPLTSPMLTGNPTVPTQSALTNNTRAASTAYADSAVAVETSRAETAEALLAPKASPTFTGTPTLPTGATGVKQSALDNSTKLATTSYTDSAVAVETTRAEAAESALIADSVLTAKGDVIAASGSAVPARVGVGSDGAVFVADSTQTAGVKWAPPLVGTITGAPIVYNGAALVNASLDPGAGITAGSNGQVLTTTSGSAGWVTPSGGPAGMNGLLGWSADPGVCDGSMAPASGAIMAVQMWMPVPGTVTYIWGVTTVVGTGLTTGQSVLGLYDNSGNQLAVTSDMSTNAAWGTAINYYKAPLTSSVVCNTQYPYVLIMCNGGTPITHRAINSGAAPPVTMNLGLATPSRAFRYSSSGSTALPPSFSAGTLTFATNGSGNGMLFGLA